MKIKRFLIKISMAVIFNCMAFSSVFASGVNWEPLKTESLDAEEVIKDQDIEIYAKPSQLIIKLGHSEKVEVFTILGRLVQSEILEEGYHRLPMDIHGVYIIKAGNITCKVVI